MQYMAVCFDTLSNQYPQSGTLRSLFRMKIMVKQTMFSQKGKGCLFMLQVTLLYNYCAKERLHKMSNCKENKINIKCNYKIHLQTKYNLLDKIIASECRL